MNVTVMMEAVMVNYLTYLGGPNVNMSISQSSYIHVNLSSTVIDEDFPPEYFTIHADTDQHFSERYTVHSHEYRCTTYKILQYQIALNWPNLNDLVKPSFFICFLHNIPHLK